MNVSRTLDTFENEKEINSMVKTLQKKGLEHMKNPDDLWHTKNHTRAIQSTHKMGMKVLANF